MDSEKLYHGLPIFAQNAICSALGWWIQLTRFGRGFLQQLIETERRDHWSMDQLLNFRDRRLQLFVQHAATTVPYYRELFREGGIDPNRIRSLSDLSGLPTLNKSVVQRRTQDFVSSAFSARQTEIVHTSGTTGAGLRFPTTLSAMQQQWAVWWRFRRRHGIDLSTWCGYFGGRSVVPIRQAAPPFWRVNGPGRQILFSGYHLSADTAELYIRYLNQHRPPWLHGYPSILSLLAEYSVKNGRSALAYCPQFITIGSENLLPRQVRIIEQVFGVRPLNNYGMTEAVANICECVRGRMHVDEDFAAVEFLPVDDRRYRIVGTNLSNPATPLLRYDAGDVVELDDTPCDCGLAGRVVRAIDGREEDYVILRNGARVGRMDHIFKDMTSVREAQIVQGKPGDLTVRVVRNPSFTAADEQQLLDAIRKFVGDLADIRLEYVERLPRGKNGKLRLVIQQAAANGVATAEPALL